MTMTPQTAIPTGRIAVTHLPSAAPGISSQPHIVHVPWEVLGSGTGAEDCRNSCFSLISAPELPKFGPMLPCFVIAGIHDQSVNAALAAPSIAGWLAACSPGIPDDVAIAHLSGSLETVVAR